jgi:hypothetical protein
MAYIGSTPTTQSFISGTDYFNGTGSQTSFTLSRPVGSVNDIQAVVNNVVQVPNDAYNVSGTSIVFTSAPSAGTGNVYVRYLSTTTQSITPSQNTVSYATWDNDLRGETFAFKNRLINGDMNIDQRNNGASITQTNGVLYGVDRWYTFGTVTSKFTLQQSTDAPAGFKNSIRATSSSAYTVGTSEQFIISQAVEGFNYADMMYGTSNAATATLSFWVKSSLTGTFAGGFGNADNNRSYSFSYTINAANTWEYKTVTFTGDLTGTWGTTSGQGVVVNFSMGTGSAFQSTANTWASGNFKNVSGAVSVVGTNGATFFITGVQLEKGTTATNFDVLPYGTELALCQRYFQQLDAICTTFTRWALGYTNTGTGTFTFPVTMRGAPTFSASGLTGRNIYNMAADSNINVGTPTLALDLATNNSARLYIGASTSLGGTAGAPLIVTPTGAICSFSAEL